MPDIFRNSRYIFFLCAIFAAASLSACSPTSSDPAPAPSSSETTPSTTATTTSATDPAEAAPAQTELPVPRPGMDVDSVKGATAFAYYFFDVLNYTAASGDTALLKEISGPDCAYCAAFQTAIDDVNSRNQHISDYQISFQIQPKLVVENPLSWGFNIDVAEAEYEIVDESGPTTVPEHISESALAVGLSKESRWIVLEMGPRGQGDE